MSHFDWENLSKESEVRRIEFVSRKVVLSMKDLTLTMWIVSCFVVRRGLLRIDWPLGGKVTFRLFCNPESTQCGTLTEFGPFISADVVEGRSSSSFDDDDASVLIVAIDAKGDVYPTQS